jgi:tryptophanyl-tRNA synthetase
MEMARDIAGKFNHTYEKVFNLPEALIQNEISVPGIDGKKNEQVLQQYYSVSMY